MNRLPRSLQGRLLVLVLGVVTAVWLVVAIATWFDVRHELDELLDSHLAQAAALLVARQAGELGDEDHALDAPTLHRYAPKVAFQVFHEGQLALKSANAPLLPMVPAGDAVQTGFRTITMDGATWRVFAARGGKRDVQVFVGEQESSRASILWAVLRSTLWPMLLALPLLAVAAWWAIYRAVAPLRQLGQVLAVRKPDALGAVVVNNAPSEMAPMLSALNALFERIAVLMESERRFTADAAHELRTPIAAIRAQAQVALGEADEAHRQHALQATLAGCDRATRLVEQLLLLSRLEAASAQTLGAVDLAALAKSVVGEQAAAALRKRQTIAVEAGRPCLAKGDATLLSALVRNLVDNAIRYSPPEACVRVSVEAVDGQACIRVEDSGPGMTPSDMQRIGERFFRVLGNDEAGSGLGWSIVRRIAQAHGAVVQVERSTDLGGLCVKVQWAPEPEGDTLVTTM